MFTKKRYESNRIEGLFDEAGSLPLDEHEVLCVAITSRNEQPSAVSELIQQRSRNFR